MRRRRAVATCHGTLAEPNMTDTVDPSVVRVLVNTAEHLGLRRADVLDDEMRAALEEDDPDRRLPSPWVRHLWTRLVACRPDEPLGVRVAETTDLSSFGALGYVITHSPTVRDALRRFLRFQRIADPRLKWSLVEALPSVRLVLRVEPWGSELRHPVEALIGVAAGGARLLHPTLSAEHVELAHPAPASAAHAEALRALCGAEVRWGAAENAVSVPASALDVTLPFADPPLGAILERHLRGVLAAVPEPGGPLARRVSELVAARLESGAATGEVARALATSRRTLQRRLRDEGTSFAAIVDETRLARALQLIADRGVRLTEIALLTGFAEARAFARAFRRWTGEGPAEHRRRLLARGTRSNGAGGPDGGGPLP